MDEFGMPASKALHEIDRLLETDGDPYFDLGSYTTVEMEPEADRLIQGMMRKNLANKNEFRSTYSIQQLVISGIASMLHAPANHFGTATAGSSEAAFLALIGAKYAWNQTKPKGLPNIVLCSNAHLCWKRAATFLDIEVREVALSDLNNYPLQPILDQVNENTILVIVTLGCTNVGLCDPIERLNQALLTLNEQHGRNTGIHVDAAIGGFVFPFSSQSRKPWDFQLPTVKSINISGHKYGLVYPGIGWLVFRTHDCFAPELIGSYEYLLGTSQSATINFSQSACFILGQYFNFLHYGHKGYRQIIDECFEKTDFLSSQLQAHPDFEVVPYSETPIVVFSLKSTEAHSEKMKRYSGLMRTRKWMLPHYALPTSNPKEVMRIVIRRDMTWPRLKSLTKDLLEVYDHLL